MKTANFYCIINPFKREGFQGGGPETYRQIIQNLKECGYGVNLITPHDEFKDPDKANLNIIQDGWNDPEGSKWFECDQLIAIRESNTPYIVSECALTACSTKPYCMVGESIIYEDGLTKITKPFFERAKVVLCTSPLHLETIQKCLNTHLTNGYCYLQEVNTDLFKNLQLERVIEYLYSGACNWYKGFDRVYEQYTDKGLRIVGPPYKVIDHDMMTHIYNITKTLVHLPRCIESFGRGVAEALLCGCEVIVNENVGAMSYKEDLSNPETYKQSKQKFKEMINELQ